MSSNVPSKCKICQAVVHEGNDTCLLHADKLDQTDYPEYRKVFSSYLFGKVRDAIDLAHGFDHHATEPPEIFFWEWFFSGHDMLDEEYNEWFNLASTSSINVSDLIFHDSDLFKGLWRGFSNRFFLLHFKNIRFLIADLHIIDTPINNPANRQFSFDDCFFAGTTTVSHVQPFSYKALFKNCFFESVTITEFFGVKFSTIFFGGKIEKELKVEFSDVNGSLVSAHNPINVGGSIFLQYCTFHDVVCLDNIFPISLEITETNFNKKLTLKPSIEKEKVLDKIILDNVRFCAVADFNGAFSKELRFYRVDSEVFFAFENTSVLEKKAVFEYTTFQGHATFRNAKFLGGLDLDRANFSGEANFLGVDADGGNIANTTRETYRLIKHSFDNIGNHLEANKFFAKEMDKYREEVSGNKSLPLWDRAVFHINKNVSDFGQNYLLPLVWLIYFSSFFYFLYLVHNYEKWLEEPQKFTCGASGYYANINCFASKFTPFKQFLVPGMEFLSLIFYIIFAILIWQTVVALKRHTRR